MLFPVIPSTQSSRSSNGVLRWGELRERFNVNFYIHEKKKNNNYRLLFSFFFLHFFKKHFPPFLPLHIAMSGTSVYRRFIQALFFALFFYQCSAQLGTTIISPVQNATVNPGEKVDILYQYQNMGNGSYVIDVDLWQDNAAETLAKNIATNVSIASGTSAGTKLAFYYNATYTWTVPHGLNSTFYLTVTTKPKLVYNNAQLVMRSRPVVLHTSAGILNMPLHKLGLLAVSIGVLILVGY